MDVISTDHAPHMMSEKDKPMEQAAFGIVGLETSACLTYTGWGKRSAHSDADGRKDEL